MDELNPDELTYPEEGEYLWEWFWELSAVRNSGNGPAPITYHDIKAWSEMTGIIIRREEIQVIRRMDNAFMSALSEELKDQRAREQQEKEDER